MRIHILASYDIISYYHFYPLFALKNKLRDFRCQVHFFTAYNASIGQCDILLIDSRFFSPLWQNQRERVFDILQDLRRRCDRIVWLDVTDSSGATQFQVMPFVDRYLKKQLLRDRGLYQKEFYGARIYTDFYRRKFSLPDEDVFRVEPIQEQYLEKLGLSWNLGIGPFYLTLKWNDLIRRLPFFLKQRVPWRYEADFRSSDTRSNAVCFRGSDQYQNLAISFQRLELLKRLKKRNIATELIPYREYVRELRQSRLCLSPFGYGEICFRDFEIILNGGMLLKPDMSHLETWPDWFVHDQTYGAFCWDFTDFEEKIDYYLSHPNITDRIRRHAQETYHSCFVSSGEMEFCQRFFSLVNTA